MLFGIELVSVGHYFFWAVFIQHVPRGGLGCRGWSLSDVATADPHLIAHLSRDTELSTILAATFHIAPIGYALFYQFLIENLFIFSISLLLQVFLRFLNDSGAFWKAFDLRYLSIKPPLTFPSVCGQTIMSCRLGQLLSSIIKLYAQFRTILVLPTIKPVIITSIAALDWRRMHSSIQWKPLFMSLPVLFSVVTNK